jgi:hypothetical protein
VPRVRPLSCLTHARQGPLKHRPGARLVAPPLPRLRQRSGWAPGTVHVQDGFPRPTSSRKSRPYCAIRAPVRLKRRAARRLRPRGRPVGGPQPLSPRINFSTIETLMIGELFRKEGPVVLSRGINFSTLNAVFAARCSCFSADWESDPLARRRGRGGGVFGAGGHGPRVAGAAWFRKAAGGDLGASRARKGCQARARRSSVRVGRWCIVHLAWS